MKQLYRIRQKSLWLDNGKDELFRLYSVFKVHAKSGVSFNPSQGLFERGNAVGIWIFSKRVEKPLDRLCRVELDL